MSVYKYDPEEEEHFVGEDDDYTLQTDDFEPSVDSVYLALQDCKDIGRFVNRVRFNAEKKTLKILVAEDCHGQVAMMLSRLGNAEDGLTISLKGPSDEFTEGHVKVFGDLKLISHRLMSTMEREAYDRSTVSHRLKFSYGSFEVRLPKAKPIKLRKGGR